MLDAHVNGALRYAGEMILNGGSLVNPSGSQGLWGSFDFAQSPDMVSEMKVLQSNYEPQYGSAAGAVVVMETKSGTNQFHGGLFGFHRNTPSTPGNTGATRFRKIWRTISAWSWAVR